MKKATRSRADEIAAAQAQIKVSLARLEPLVGPKSPVVLSPEEYDATLRAIQKLKHLRENPSEIPDAIDCGDLMRPPIKDAAKSKTRRREGDPAIDSAAATILSDDGIDSDE